MARILAEKTESSSAPSHSFRMCTTFWRGTSGGDAGDQRSHNRSYRARLIKKVELRSLADLVRFAVRNKLVEA
jgi:hypothetical protein